MFSSQKGGEEMVLLWHILTISQSTPVSFLLFCCLRFVFLSLISITSIFLLLLLELKQVNEDMADTLIAVENTYETYDMLNMNMKQNNNNNVDSKKFSLPFSVVVKEGYLYTK